MGAVYCSDKWIFRKFLKQIMKLFTGLQSYLPGQEISGTNIKVMWMETVFVKLCGCRGLSSERQ